MGTYMNKKGIIGGITFIIIIVIIILVWARFLSPALKYDKDCLKEIAVDVCNNNGHRYSSTNMFSKPSIYCYETSRSIKTIELRFLPEELKECEL